MSFSENLAAAMDNRNLTDPAKPWHTFAATGTCCDSRICRALRNGELDNAGLWACPVCGCDWRPRQVEGVLLWVPYPIVEVFRPRT